MAKVESGSRPKILLFTLSYPFSFAAESNFLNPELAELSEHFDITVIPRSTIGELEAMPNGCSLDLSFANLISRDPPRGLARLRRLANLGVFLELVHFFPRTFDIRMIRRIVDYSLLRSYIKSWVSGVGAPIASTADLIYGWWLTPEILAVSAECRKLRVLTVARAHGGDLYEFRDVPPGKPYRRSQIHNLARIWPDSETGERYLRERHPKLARRIYAKHLGTQDFGVAVYNPDQTFRTVTCSFIDPVKQLHFAAAGLIRAAFKHPSIQFEWTHIGNGDSTLIFPEGLVVPENLRFVHLAYPGISSLREIYLTSNFDVFLNTSFSEGVPVAMMEAASCGIPLIGPRVGGVPEILHDGENGILMKDGASAQAVCDAVCEFVSMSSLTYLNMRHQSRKIWEDKFNSKRNYRSFAFELKTLIASNSGR